ncbi:MAG: hypothetical protein ACXAD7_09705 [Candidatus Kariarchaeaceae archaeon]
MFYPNYFIRFQSNTDAQSDPPVSDKKFGFSDLDSTYTHWSEFISDPNFAFNIEEILEHEILQKEPKHHYYEMYQLIQEDPLIHDLLITEIGLLNGDQYHVLEHSLTYKRPLMIQIGMLMAVILSLKLGYDEFAALYI